MRQATPHHKRAAAKPILIAVPGGLIQQWIDEVKAVAPGLKVFKYHGEPRVKSTGDWEILSKLDSDHPLFQEWDECARSIIFTTLETLGVRHGPRALAAYLRKEQGLSKKQAEEAMNRYQNFPGSLRNLFQLVVLDEAHSVKNMYTEANISLH